MGVYAKVNQVLMRPFFNFYGGKWRAAPKYPAPRFNTIVEHFAGSAGYALRYANRRVVLVEKDPIIAGVWAYLIRASADEIIRLPLIAHDQTIDDLVGVCQEAKWLIGFWLTGAASSPRRSPTSWMKSGQAPGSFWGPRARDRIASQVDQIRHWTIVEASYDVPSVVEATHFVDPPYQKAGKHYRCSSRTIDFARLATFCEQLPGQVIVCENEGADWLPFRPFADVKSNPANARRASNERALQSREVVWIK